MIVNGEHYPVETRLRHHAGSEWVVKGAGYDAPNLGPILADAA